MSVVPTDLLTAAFVSEIWSDPIHPPSRHHKVLSSTRPLSIIFFSNVILVFQYLSQLGNCSFVQWVDPQLLSRIKGTLTTLRTSSSITLSRSLSRLTPPYPPCSEENGVMAGPMVFKTNTGCEHECHTCPCHEKKDNTPPTTPSSPLSPQPPPPPGYYMPSQHSGGSMFSEQF
jgi:hypothetical protein